MRVEVDQGVGNVWLTLLRLRSKQRQIADVKRHLNLYVADYLRNNRLEVPRQDQTCLLRNEHVLIVDLDEAVE